MGQERLYDMTMAKIYPLYIKKVEKKGQTKEDLDTIIYWLTGYDEQAFIQAIDEEVTLRQFFREAPLMNPNRSLIKGVICGIRVEEIEEPLMQEIRYLDKLVDELAKGKAMGKILRG